MFFILSLSFFFVGNYEVIFKIEKGKKETKKKKRTIIIIFLKKLNEKNNFLNIEKRIFLSFFLI